MRIRKLNEDSKTPAEVGRDIALAAGFKAKVSSRGSLWLQYPCDIYKLRAILKSKGIDVGGSTSVRRGNSGYWEWRSYPNVSFCEPDTEILSKRDAKEAEQQRRKDTARKYADELGFSEESRNVYIYTEPVTDNIQLVYSFHPSYNSVYMINDITLRTVHPSDNLFDDNSELYDLRNKLLEMLEKNNYELDNHYVSTSFIRLILKPIRNGKRDEESCAKIIKENKDKLKYLNQDIKAYFTTNNKKVKINWRD